MTMRPLFSLLSPGGAHARLSVLIFHRVLPAPDPLFPDEVDTARFDQMLGWLKGWFNVLPLDEAVRRLQAGSLPRRAAALSFDDGYADNHDEALPLLRRHGLPCSFFIATDFLDGGRMWNDSLIEAVRRSPLPSLDLRGMQGHDGQEARDLGRHSITTIEERRTALQTLIPLCKYLPPRPRQALVDAIAARAEAALPDDLMMSSAQVRALRDAGMQIGAHTASHPILASLSENEAADEMARGKARLEQILGERVTMFAYPNGKPGTDYLPQRDPGLARELGFESAVSTAWGAARGGRSDPFQIPRFTPWDRGRGRFGLRLLRNFRPH
ncbi:MAG: polysaccharide deacetylase family protein [Burkholderiales bacterium]|jgi:peptidoglycan/xylan/chitin deacetylase (PgdA/CDA1 family)|nr:polysaccharide deacetylase family protein [Burkholderiales bacterium]MBW8892452.1 polysaccharide deacetylase family protein [Burkholderiales bacterium]